MGGAISGYLQDPFRWTGKGEFTIQAVYTWFYVLRYIVVFNLVSIELHYLAMLVVDRVKQNILYYNL